MRPTVRPATTEDLEAYFPGAVKPTVRAWVGELDGKLIGIGGYAFAQGRWIAFCDLTKDARKYKFQIARTAKMIMGEAKKQGLKYVYVDINKEESGAEKWLKSLGFSLDPKTLYLYRWRGK